MAKAKRAAEALSNLDWDSPPNNKFKPWPIEPEFHAGDGQGARGKQQTSEQQRNDSTHEQQ